MLRCPNLPREVVREARGWHGPPPPPPAAFALAGGVFWQGKTLPAQASLARNPPGPSSKRREEPKGQDFCLPRGSRRLSPLTVYAGIVPVGGTIGPAEVAHHAEEGGSHPRGGGVG